MEPVTNSTAASPTPTTSAAQVTAADEWVISGHLDRSGSPSDWSIQPTPFRVGRHPGLELFLPYATVSSLHAELTADREGLWVIDCNSTNGTYVNGRRIDRPARLQSGDYVQFADHVFRVSLADKVMSADTACGQMDDAALAVAQVEHLIQHRAITPHYQPVVDNRTQQVVGYECLSRSSLFGLSNPQLMFEAASQLNLCASLSSVCRAVSLEPARLFEPDLLVFVNTHPAELSNLDRLQTDLEAIRTRLPYTQIVIEVHESTVAEVQLVQELRQVADRYQMKIAYDDFGVGQTRILELSECPPDYLKFDMSLIRGIDAANGRRQHLLANLIRTVHELGVATLAEGMETEAEATTCQQLGFMYAQGFYFGHPKPAQYWLEQRQAKES